MPSPIIVGVALRDDDSAPLALAHRLARLTAAPLALVTSYPYDESPPFVASEGLAAMREQAELALEPLVATSPDDVNVSTYVGPGMTAAHALHDVAIELDAAAIVVGSDYRGHIGRVLAGESTYVRPGTTAARALHDVAIELDAAAIVVGSSHRGRIGRVLAGDVSTSLLHGAPCPVAVAPRDYTEGADGFRRIGVGFVDTLEGRAALTAASGLARTTGGSLVVFSVQEPIESFEAEFEQRAQQTGATARRLIPEDLHSSVEMPSGNPATILAAASAHLDLLVCGSRGYGPMRSVILGSVSRELTRSAACPLLVVPRPPAKDATTPWRNRAASWPAGAAG
jgi:nucleotide-binding universal stress UspA family protein